MKLCFAIIVIFSVASSLVQGQDQYYGVNEEPCSRAGGRCILKSECNTPPEVTGLCPKQQAQGFECCYGVPKSETRCHKFGGVCMEQKDCKRPETRAKNCSPNQACCVLVVKK